MPAALHSYLPVVRRERESTSAEVWCNISCGGGGCSSSLEDSFELSWAVVVARIVGNLARQITTF